MSGNEDIKNQEPKSMRKPDIDSNSEPHSVNEIGNQNQPVYPITVSSVITGVHEAIAKGIETGLKTQTNMEVKRLNKVSEDLNKRNALLTMEVKSLRKENDGLKQKIEQVVKDHENLKIDFKDYEKQIKQKDDKIKKVNKSNELLKKKNKEIKSELNKAIKGNVKSKKEPQTRPNKLTERKHKEEVSIDDDNARNFDSEEGTMLMDKSIKISSVEKVSKSTNKRSTRRAPNKVEASTPKVKAKQGISTKTKAQLANQRKSIEVIQEVVHDKQLVYSKDENESQETSSEKEE